MAETPTIVLVHGAWADATGFDADGYKAGLDQARASNPDAPNFDPAPYYTGLAVAADANERGWKDTVRVNPDEMVTIGATFEGYTGRYMYHCHILEHEDRDMMRPIVIMPAELLPFMT